MKAIALDSNKSRGCNFFCRMSGTRVVVKSRRSSHLPFAAANVSCNGCLATMGALEWGSGPAPTAAVSSARAVPSSDREATVWPSGMLRTSMEDALAQTTFSAELLKQSVLPEPLLLADSPEGATVKSSESTVTAASQPLEALVTVWRARVVVLDQPIDSTGFCTLNCISARIQKPLLLGDY